MSRVRCVDLAHRFRATHSSFHVLHDISFELAPGEHVGLVGRSGSGKTTLGKLLTGHLSARSGQILVDGVRPRDHGGVQMIPQDPRLLLPSRVPIEMLVQETLLTHEPQAATPAHARAILDRVGLARRAHAPADALSGGEQRRAALARILATRPVFIFADELTSGLDVHLRFPIVEILLETVGPDCTVLMVSHDTALIRSVCDRTLVLDAGRLVEDITWSTHTSFTTNTAKTLFSHTSRTV